MNIEPNHISSNNAQISPEHYLTTGQAARELSLAPGTLQNWRTEGIGPKFFKHRNRVFYLKTDIQAYMAEHYIVCRSTAEWREKQNR